MLSYKSDFSSYVIKDSFYKSGHIQGRSVCKACELVKCMHSLDAQLLTVS